jgi:DNA polymerase-3 subunit alpha
MKTLKFKCGCEFPIVGPPLHKDAPLPALRFDPNNVCLNCPEVWALLGKGYTKGVFQLESNLGRSWCRKLKPENIEHLSALGSILRPGALRAFDENGISTTEHYCRRKNNEEPVSYYHPSLEPILKSTYGLNVYQEQSMEIARQLAGFDLQKADELRKAIGKKLPEEMRKVEVKFIEGCKQTKIVNEREAEQIFSEIKQSQRYQFNKSHSMCYAVNGYRSAYAKAHFPVEFFTSYLLYSHEKQKPLREINELINEAKLMDIEVLPPDIRNLEVHFSTDGRVITFGLQDVKGIGEAQCKNLINAIRDAEAFMEKPINEWNWYIFLVVLHGNVGSAVLKNLISVGALRAFENGQNTNVGRTQEVRQPYKRRSGLDQTELDFLQVVDRMPKSLCEA